MIVIYSKKSLLLNSLVLLLVAACGPAQNQQSRTLSSTRVGICYRHVASCQREVRMVEPSTDAELNEAAVEIITEGRMPEPCVGGDSDWHGVYIYKDSSYIGRARPDCSALLRH